MRKGNEPVDRLKAWTGAGNVEVSIWENDGRFSVTCQRSYKKNGKWQQSQSFFPQDLPILGHVLGKAFDRIDVLDAENRE